MRYKYKEIIFDDVVLKSADGLNNWSQICHRCKVRHNIDEKKLDNFGSGTCGIEGCNREAEYYIDFEDKELTKVD
jgi:hypothetical protein